MAQILTLRGLRVASFLAFDDQNPYLTRGFCSFGLVKIPTLRGYIMNLSGIAEIIHHICKDRVGFIRICRCARKNLSGIADIMHHISIFRERKICAISF